MTLQMDYATLDAILHNELYFVSFESYFWDGRLIIQVAMYITKL